MIDKEVDAYETITKSEIKKEAMAWIKTIVFGVLLGLVLTRGILVNAQVPSQSMENTIMTDDRLFAYRLAYLFKEPERDDVIVFPCPDNDKLYIKRIIGMPGETVEGINGKVYINGQPLDEPYIKEPINEDFGPYQVPADHYFMMGDNRNDSEDSRYWEHHYLEKDNIKGKAFLKYSPDFELIN